MSWTDWATSFASPGPDSKLELNAVIYCKASGAVWGSHGTKEIDAANLAKLPNLSKKAEDPANHDIAMPSIANDPLRFLKKYPVNDNIYMFKGSGNVSGIDLPGPDPGCRILVFSTENKCETYLEHVEKIATNYLK